MRYKVLPILFIKSIAYDKLIYTALFLLERVTKTQNANKYEILLVRENQQLKREILYTINLQWDETLKILYKPQWASILHIYFELFYGRQMCRILENHFKPQMGVNPTLIFELFFL